MDVCRSVDKYNRECVWETENLLQFANDPYNYDNLMIYTAGLIKFLYT